MESSGIPRLASSAQYGRVLDLHRHGVPHRGRSVVIGTQPGGRDMTIVGGWMKKRARFVRHLSAVAIAAAVAAAVVLSTAGVASAASPRVAAQHPALIDVYRSDVYPVLDWDQCRDSTGEYIFIEAHTSVCGSQWPGNVWSFSFVGRRSSFGVNKLEVCHSGDHSGTTVMEYGDDDGTHTLSDAAGGGCAIAYGHDV